MKSASERIKEFAEEVGRYVKMKEELLVAKRRVQEQDDKLWQQFLNGELWEDQAQWKLNGTPEEQKQRNDLLNQKYREEQRRRPANWPDWM